MRAFLFPGQGSQKIGMGRALQEAFPEARAVFEEADAVLGRSLSRLCFEGPEAELALTANAQPAILTTSVAALRVLEKETGLRPDVVAGHSLGEYTALVAAGALELADAVRLVHLRGKFMQEALPEGLGSMAAILGLPAEQVAAACAEVASETGAVVSPANFNGAGQVVIAGARAAVDRAVQVLKERGAKRAIPLAVSAPFHCALMRPAAERLAGELERLRLERPRVPVVTNVEAAPNQDPDRLRALLVEQVTAPVRWEESMQKLEALGVTEAIELGAGAVLAGLLRRIVPTLKVTSVGDPEQVACVAAEHACTPGRQTDPGTPPSARSFAGGSGPSREPK
jgi:[acyl-carrier-protein] S-malonyltransferase